MSGIGQGNSFPWRSTATGRPAMVGALTTEVTGKDFGWELRPIDEKTTAHKLAGIKTRFQGFVILVDYTAIRERGL